MTLIKFVVDTARRTFFLAVIAGALAGLSMVAVLALTNKALHQVGAVSPGAVLLYCGLIALVFLSRVSSTVLLTRLIQDSIANLRLKLSREILAAPLINLEVFGPHRLLASLSADINTISNGIMRLPLLFMNSAIIFGCLLYLLWLSWIFFLIALTVIFVGAQVYRWSQARALSLFKRAREYNDDLYKGFRAVCEGTKELKMNQRRRMHFLSGHFEKTVRSYADDMVSGKKYYSLAGNFGVLLFFVVIGALVFLVPNWLEVEQSALVGYVMILLFLQGPLEFVMSSIPELAKTAVSLKKVQSLGWTLNTDVKSQAREKYFGAEVLDYKKNICLKNVTHKYYREMENSHFKLGPVNLTFRPGEIVFLVGGNGSGKTTLAKMLLGLYEPESGVIFVDGEKLCVEQYEQYRQLFSPVFVDFFLFDELLGLENIAIEEKATAYLEALQLNHKVKIENGVLSTVQLSQGQKKRLTLLVAYLEDRPFYVFDEWAADQDPEFKRVFYRTILPDLRKKNKTVLVISHDEQYFDVADRRIKMESGRVIEGESIESAAVV